MSELEDSTGLWLFSPSSSSPRIRSLNYEGVLCCLLAGASDEAGILLLMYTQNTGLNILIKSLNGRNIYSVSVDCYYIAVTVVTCSQHHKYQFFTDHT